MLDAAGRFPTTDALLAAAGGVLAVIAGRFGTADAGGWLLSIVAVACLVTAAGRPPGSRRRRAVAR